MNSKKIIIHCQYVYGLGHLVRALHLAKGLAKYFDVYFLNGGEIVKNYDFDSSINFIQLPAIYKKEENNELTSVSNDLSIEECLERRNKIILDIIQREKPDLIITEHFPFGFLFENEVMNLINYAKGVNSKVKVVCSVRDVIENAKGSVNDEKTIDILNKLYDLLLIHGDENLLPFNLSFPLVKNIKTKISYTGYVVDPILLNKNYQNKSDIILVSIAGGRVGSELLEAVINAFELIKFKTKYDLVVFNGAFNSKLKVNKTDNRIKYFNFNREDFLNQLSISNISISLGGYNSTIESICSGNKVIIYNRSFLGSNNEQDIRISTLKKSGLIDVINFENLEIKSLSKEILNQIKKNKITPKSYDIDFKGVNNTVNQIKQLIESK